MRDDNTEKRVSNKYMHYYLDSGLSSYALKKRTDYLNGISLLAIRQEVELVLAKHGIPKHWIESVMDIVKGEDNITPDHEYIALKVDDLYIFSSTFVPEAVKKKVGSPLVVEINGQVSKTELKHFIDRHNDLIEKTTKLLKLPKTKYLTDISFDENLLATIGKESGMKISEIAKFIDPKFPDGGDYSTTKRQIKRGIKTRDTS